MLPLAPGESWHHLGHPRPLRLAVRCASAVRSLRNIGPAGRGTWGIMGVHGRSRPACHNGSSLAQNWTIRPVPRPLPRTVQCDDLSVGLTSSQANPRLKTNTSTRAIRRLLTTAYKCRNQTPPQGHRDARLSKAGRQPSVSLPHHHLARRHAVDASGHPPLANPSLRLNQEPNISNPRHPYEQPQAFDHTTLPDNFSYISEPIRKPPSHPKDDGNVRDRLGNASAGTALNMRLSSIPHHPPTVAVRCGSGVTNPPSPSAAHDGNPTTTTTPGQRRTEVSMTPPPRLQLPSA